MGSIGQKVGQRLGRNPNAWPKARPKAWPKAWDRLLGILSFWLQTVRAGARSNGYSVITVMVSAESHGLVNERVS